MNKLYRKVVRFNREKFFRAVSRAVNGAVPASRPHSSKKGKRGYSRVQGKKVED
ncbi:MAG: hypothetical protein AAB575_03325 [Patescibacteria group bacterium]